MRDREAQAAEIVALATELGVRIAVAESLTGGMLAAAIVSAPGASAVFTGGVVAYDSALKASILGVDRAVLGERGPVDGEVARQMAAGVRHTCAVESADGSRRIADLGIATTGVAGPASDAQSGQPAGTVWIGVSSAAGERSVLLPVLAGNRQAIREQTVDAALGLVVEALLAQKPAATQRFPGET
ncbi:MAG: nicotinamide-nucleotide amidohydrolase family protein [Leucobacter sp.]|nr:nicotinamide-nucleotide amidohydrolase family protein [Leucobacter sp.]